MAEGGVKKSDYSIVSSENEDYVIYKVSSTGKQKAITILRHDMDSKYHSIAEKIVRSQSPYILRDRIDNPFKTFLYICKGKVNAYYSKGAMGFSAEEFENITEKYSTREGKDIATIQLPKVKLPKFSEIYSETCDVPNSSFQRYLGLINEKDNVLEDPKAETEGGLKHSSPIPRENPTETSNVVADELLKVGQLWMNSLSTILKISKPVDTENREPVTVDTSEFTEKAKDSTQLPVYAPPVIKVKQIIETPHVKPKKVKPEFVRGVHVKTVADEQLEKAREEEELRNIKTWSYEQRYLHPDVDTDHLVNEIDDITSDDVESWDQDNESHFIPDYIQQIPSWSGQKWRTRTDELISCGYVPQESQLPEWRQNLRETSSHYSTRLPTQSVQTERPVSRDPTDYLDSLYYQGSLKMRYPSSIAMGDIDMFKITKHSQDCDPNFVFAGGVSGFAFPPYRPLVGDLDQYGGRICYSTGLDSSFVCKKGKDISRLSNILRHSLQDLDQKDPLWKAFGPFGLDCAPPGEYEKLMLPAFSMCIQMTQLSEIRRPIVLSIRDNTGCRNMLKAAVTVLEEEIYETDRQSQKLLFLDWNYGPREYEVVRRKFPKSFFGIGPKIMYRRFQHKNYEECLNMMDQDYMLIHSSIPLQRVPGADTRLVNNNQCVIIGKMLGSILHKSTEDVITAANANYRRFYEIN